MADRTQLPYRLMMLLSSVSICVEKWWGHKGLDERKTIFKQSLTYAILGNVMGGSV